MTAPETPDPKLLLPDWLRDAEIEPCDESLSPQSKTAIEVSRSPVAIQSNDAELGGASFSSRLAVDQTFDPFALVTEADLPSWLSGLGSATAPVSLASPAAVQIHPDYGDLLVEGREIAGAEPVAGDESVVVEVSGRYLFLGAIALLILLAGALRLYLS